jgi:hypothetical protein
MKKVFVLLFVLFSLSLGVTAQQKRKPVTVRQTPQTKQPSSDTENVPTTPDKSVQPQPQVKTDEKFNLIKQISDFAQISFSEKNVGLTLYIPSKRGQYLNNERPKYLLRINSNYKYNLFSDTPKMTLDLDSLGEREKFELTNEINVFADSEKIVFARPAGTSYGNYYIPKDFEINFRHLETFAASNSLTFEVANSKIELDEYNLKAIKLFNQLLKSGN